MTTYIIIVFVLLLISLILLNLRHFEKLRKNDKTFSFLLSLLSTFVGFFIALAINTNLDNQKQKQNLIKILNAANLSLENTEMKVQGMYLNPALSGKDINEVVYYSPLEMPKMYASLETNSLVTDYFSNNAFQSYILCSDNMRSFLKKINAENVSEESRLRLLNDFKAYLKIAKKINEIEIQYLDGKLSNTQETNELDKISKSLIITQ